MAGAEVALPDGACAAPSVRAARVWTACGLLNVVSCFSMGSDRIPPGSRTCGRPDMPTGGLLSLGLTRRCRWAGAVSSPFTLSAPPPKTRKLTHALLSYFSDDPRHQQSVQMEIPKQGKFLNNQDKKCRVQYSLNFPGRPRRVEPACKTLPRLK